MEQWLLISQGEVIVMLVITLSVRSVCLTVFVYLFVRSPISQYKFVKYGTIVTKLYIEITGYIR